jgi:hypothetical protein
MRTVILVILVGALLAGCASMPDQQKRALIGVGIGAGIGALVGSAVASGPGAIAVGAVVGSAAGGIIAAYAKPEGCFFRNKRGELWQVPCSYAPRGPAACFIGRAPDGLQKIDCPRGFAYRGR